MTTDYDHEDIAHAVSLFGERETNYQALRKHVIAIIKDRSIIFTGDESHMSGRWAVKKFERIDVPRKYDFQDEDVNEQEFIRLITQYWLPSIGFEMGAETYNKFTPEAVEAIIAGTMGVKIPIKGYDKACSDCDQRMFVSIKGKEVHLGSDHVCHKNSTFSVEIDFPTGELVFSDWPARFGEAENAGFIVDEDFDVNKLSGQRKSTESYAKHNNTFFASVGNSSPHLFVTGNGEGTGTKIRIGKGASGFKDVGYFCTDLWWTTIIDKRFYDQIIAKLPPADSKKNGGYEKEVQTTKVKPGRYRFTIVDRYADYDEDADYGPTLYSVAEWIGPCEKEDYVFPERTLMEWDEVCQFNALRYSNGNVKPEWKYNPHVQSFNTADYIFNTIGNGLRSMGDLLSHYHTDNIRLVPAANIHLDEEVDLKPPYPNFQKQYSTVWCMDPTLLPKSWVLAAIDFYTECALYFQDGAKDYHEAYPYKNQSDMDSMTKNIMGQKDNHKTEEEWFKYIQKNYSRDGAIPFTGDVDAFAKARWEYKKAESIKFCQDTIVMLVQKCFNGDMDAVRKDLYGDEEG